MKDFTLVPITLDEANAFVAEHHRHHKHPVPGCKFSIALAVNDKVIAVAIVGRPVARMIDDGWTLEINRLCTDGTANSSSCLLAACRRAAFALGYKRLVTYTLPTESGRSLIADNWKCLGEAGGGMWSRESRPRVDKAPMQGKLKWMVEAA